MACLWKIALPVVLLGTGAVAQDMSIGAPQVTGSLGGGVVISAQAQHAQGPAAIAMMAIEITSDAGTWSYPSLNDTGTAGDLVAGDGIWSVSADMPGAAAGAYTVTLYMLDTAGAELVSDPSPVTLN